MKKLIIALVLVAMMAMMTVNCFAVSTAVSDLDLIFFDDFEDAKKYDYENSENYIAEVSDGKLYLMSMTGTKSTAYELPGAEPLAGVEKLTAAYSFEIETFANLTNVNFTLGGKDTDNFFTMGLSTGNANGSQTFYSPIVDRVNSVPNPWNNNEKEATRTYSYLYKDEAFTTPWSFEQGVTYTVVIELEKGGEPQFTYYADGQPIEHYAKGNDGKIKENGTAKARDYLFGQDTTFTMDGNIGLSVTRGGAILFNGVAVYKSTGLDHKELIAKVNTAGSGDAPATEAPTTEAPTTEAPVTEAPTTEAPVTEAPTTEAPVTEAPTTEAPVTDAPTTDAPTTEAPKASGGCGGVIGVGAIVAILGTAVVLKKRD